MEEFLLIFNKIHKSIKRGSRENLPVETITKEYLFEAGIIDVKSDKIIYLDTTLIAENYLMLWNERLIECLEDLEHLVLANLELRELDLSSQKQLKRIELKSCKRDAIIYIAENRNLEKLDTNNLDVNDKNSCPIFLYAHPKQIGSIVSPEIEEACRDKEGYLAVTLHLAPPKHDTVVANDLPLKYLLRFKEAELGDILKQYWAHQPDYYTKYKSLEEAHNHEKEVFGILLEVEKRVGEGFYLSKNTSFDPNIDIVYPKLTERVLSGKRTIPTWMLQKV